MKSSTTAISRIGSLLSLIVPRFVVALVASILGLSAVEAGNVAGQLGAILLLTAAFTIAYVVVALFRGRPKSTRTVDTRDLAALLTAVGAAGLIGFALGFVVPGIDLKLAPVIVATCFATFLGIVLRVGLAELEKRRSEQRPNAQRTIVVGSGEAAASLVRLIRENENFQYSVVGCVDDEVLSHTVGGKPVLGGIDDLPRLISQHRAACVIIAIPSASAPLIKRVMNNCAKGNGYAGRPPAVRVLPGVLELLNDGVKEFRIRPVRPEDLLPRDPVKVDLAEIVSHVEHRVILVTGAGGSIGSELCRQLITLNPSLLLLFGHGENSLFAIDEELRVNFGFSRTKIILGDVADAARVRNVFSQYHPHVVFHAAAHKHVPIVEENVCEAARNNVLGTHVVALAAAAAGVAKFVLLSTDKAVNPTSVMGATKRLSEIISQSFVNQTGTEFVTVRFGNVLESRGSVIPIFKKQIETGGPVTITHRDMQRYFMTIPEAVSLVLQAMAIGRDGQVLVLDMGKPVNILKLAETLITLSGLTPYRDISIVETGIRPGEKLFEEILTNLEGMSTTSHSRLFIAQQERIAYETLAFGLRALESGVRTGDQNAIVDILSDFVPSYQPGAHFQARKAQLDGQPSAVETIATGNGHASAVDGKAQDGSHPVEVIGS